MPAEFKGTPGPWRRAEDDLGAIRVRSADGEMVAAVYCRENSKEEEPNARLVAAAPEVFVALVDAVAHGRHPGVCGWWDGRHSHALIHQKGVCNCWISRAKAALQLATA